jgi:hypothetical protein
MTCLYKADKSVNGSLGNIPRVYAPAELDTERNGAFHQMDQHPSIWQIHSEVALSTIFAQLQRCFGIHFKINTDAFTFIDKRPLYVIFEIQRQRDGVDMCVAAFSAQSSYFKKDGYRAVLDEHGPQRGFVSTESNFRDWDTGCMGKAYRLVSSTIGAAKSGGIEDSVV